MLGGELGVEGDALALQVRHGFERRLEVAGDLRAEGGGLLDRGVLGEDEELGARCRAVGHPACDLVPPRLLRGRLVDRVLRGGNRERCGRPSDGLAALVDQVDTSLGLQEVRSDRTLQSARIQNCIG